MVTVKLFALLKDKIKRSEICIPDAPATVAGLLRRVSNEYPALADALIEGRILVSVNQEFATPDMPIRDGDEVGLMPPFSGGQERHGVIRIQEEPFSVDAEIERIKRTSRSIGGIVMFLGTTRDVSRGVQVTKLEFEHYPGMAEKRLAEIRERAIKEYCVIDLSIIHRTGALPVGENIVLIVAAAGHRDEAFKACRFCIDELKRITPIWKKETTRDGVVWVKEHP